MLSGAKWCSQNNFFVHEVEEFLSRLSCASGANGASSVKGAKWCYVVLSGTE